MNDYKVRVATSEDRGAPRIPSEVRDAVITRDECRRRLREAEADLREALAPYTGQTFYVEGVPMKVCGAGKRLYVKRMVKTSEAERLRAEWRAG